MENMLLKTLRWWGTPSGLYHTLRSYLPGVLSGGHLRHRAPALRNLEHKGARSNEKLLTRPAKGQSLVEMAIITPLLIFFMLGIFEVGWALRNYLVLVNVNREITRFAVRPGYLNFSTLADVNTSFQRATFYIDEIRFVEGGS